MVLSGLSTNDVVLYANIYFAVLIGILLLISAVYAARARRGLLVEVDAWVEQRRIEILVCSPLYSSRSCPFLLYWLT